MKHKKVFYHDIANCTADQVVGNYLYSARALGLTEPDDVILLHPDFQGELEHIVAHYERIGLSHTHNVVWDVSVDVLRKYPEHELSVFFFGDNIHEVKPDEAWFKVVDYINSKNNFMRLAEELGLAVPKTFCFSDKSAISNFDKFPFPCYLKASVSVSGVGIYRCEDIKAFEQALSRFEENVPLQVQQEVKTNQFLNLQYQITDNGLQRLLVTEQILDGFVHKGNRFPASHEPWESVEAMAEWMYDKGMQGIFAFDVGIVEEGDTVQYLPIECNPRFNGASYPTGIAQKLGLTGWTYEFFYTKHRSLASFDFTDLEFNPKTKTGVIMVNWGPLLIGKLGILFAGSLESQAELKTEIEKRL